jgi:hypothetical protein
MGILNERVAIAYEVRCYVIMTHLFQLMIFPKLEGLVDTQPGLESSLLTTDAGSQATACACHRFLSFSFTY